MFYFPLPMPPFWLAMAITLVIDFSPPEIAKGRPFFMERPQRKLKLFNFAGKLFPQLVYSEICLIAIVNLYPGILRIFKRHLKFSHFHY